MRSHGQHGTAEPIASPRRLAAVRPLALVQVHIPEYAAAGLGRALLRVVGHPASESNRTCAVSVVAASSRVHVLYEDMLPEVVADDYQSAWALAPNHVVDELFRRGLPAQAVALAALRYPEFDDVDEVIAFVERYVARATWLEANPVESFLINLHAKAGTDIVHDWPALLASTKH